MEQTESTTENHDSENNLMDQRSEFHAAHQQIALSKPSLSKLA